MDLADRESASHIGQPIASSAHGVADAAAQGAQRFNLAAAGMGNARGRSAHIGTAADIGPGIVAFNTKDPWPILPIVSDRAADHPSAEGIIPVCRRDATGTKVNPINRTSGNPRIGLIGMTPAITACNADIWSSPIVKRCDD